jgi:hypothetical protein
VTTAITVTDRSALAQALRTLKLSGMLEPWRPGSPVSAIARLL